jgi:Cu-Zn family superoxide dismutase
LIVHADEDDLRSQPSGEAGDPVACGVIELAETPQIDR